MKQTKSQWMPLIAILVTAPAFAQVYDPQGPDVPPAPLAFEKDGIELVTSAKNTVMVQTGGSYTLCDVYYWSHYYSDWELSLRDTSHCTGWDAYTDYRVTNKRVIPIRAAAMSEETQPTADQAACIRQQAEALDHAYRDTKNQKLFKEFMGTRQFKIVLSDNRSQALKENDPRIAYGPNAAGVPPSKTVGFRVTLTKKKNEASKKLEDTCLFADTWQLNAEFAKWLAKYEASAASPTDKTGAYGGSGKASEPGASDDPSQPSDAALSASAKT